MQVLKVTATQGQVNAVAVMNGREYACVIGKNGVVAASEKREGDGKTPLGLWPLTGGYYRPDRVAPAGVCTEALDSSMGWCDAPEHELYNQPCDVTLPASHEALWRKDASYDYIGVMDYNLDGQRAPDGKGLGSAIFLHVWREDATHTEGCVALRDKDLEEVLKAGVEAVEVVLAG